MTYYTKSMSEEPNYSYLQLELEGAIVSQPPMLIAYDSTLQEVTVSYETSLTAGEQTTLNAVIDAHDPIPLVALIKSLATLAHDNFNNVMMVGFTYDSKQFPLTVAARADWATFLSAKDSLTYPVNIPSANGTIYSVVDSAVVQAMFDNASTYGRDAVNDYSEALNSIVTATTKEEAQTAYNTYIGA